MKKVIIALVLFVMILVAAIAEIQLSSHIYEQFLVRLQRLDTLVDQHSEDMSVDAVTAAVDTAERYWAQHRDFLAAFSHHNIAREVERGMVRVRNYIQLDDHKETKVELGVLIRFVDEMGTDNHLTLTNIF